MEEQDKIDMQLWEYIDGTCGDAERSRIAELIDSDALWGKKYRELSAFNANIYSEFELEQPSMRFAKNVMDIVAASAIAPSTARYINPAIVKGIAAFFLISLAIVTGMALFSVKWSITSSPAFSNIHLPEINTGNWNIKKYMSSTVIQAAIAVNIIVGLVLADTMLRKRSRVKHS